MKRRIRNFLEKLIEGILMISSTVTTLTVLLIIVFLFRSGLSIFGKTPLEEGNLIAISKDNKVTTLSAYQLKQIFDREKDNWSSFGGSNDLIKILTLDNITEYYSEEQLGENFSKIPNRVNDFLRSNKGGIVYVAKQYMPGKLEGRLLNLGKIYPGNFISGKYWYPTTQPAVLLGVLPLIIGTLFVSFGAILIALPLGIATAVFMAEIANDRLRGFLKPVVELLAGIPSVVYGFFGLVIVVPFIKDLFNLPVGETGLAGSIILGIMALPTIITISEDALRTTPRALKEASLALGASHWQTIRRVVIPYAKSGITAAIVLGIGRAVGETMAVLMVTGNAAIIPHSFLEPLRTIPATIAAELGEAPYGGLHFKALFALGTILFLITFIINLTFEFIARKRKY